MEGMSLIHPFCSYNLCHARTCVKVECVIRQMKKKFTCLTKTIQYQPRKVCKIIKACGFLWNFGILTGYNKGYNPDDYIIANKQELDDEIEATFGGHL